METSLQIEENSLTFEKCFSMGKMYARQLKHQRVVIESLAESGCKTDSTLFRAAVIVYEKIKRNMIYYAQEANKFRNL